MRLVFIVLVCFALGNLNYHIFVQVNPSSEEIANDLEIENSEKFDISIELNKGFNSKDYKNGLLQVESPKKEKGKILAIKSKSEKRQNFDPEVESKSSSKKIIEKEYPEDSVISKDDDLFFEERNLFKNLENDFYENKKNKSRRAKIKKRLEGLFSKKTYPWVKRVSSLEGVKSQRGSLSFYPWGHWSGQYLSSDGVMRLVTLKLKRKRHALNDLVNLSMKVGKGKKLHLVILKNFPLKTAGSKEFLNRFHYFSFSINKETRLILFKTKKQKAFRGMIKLKRDEKEYLLATFRLKKLKINNPL